MKHQQHGEERTSLTTDDALYQSACVSSRWSRELGAGLPPQRGGFRLCGLGFAESLLFELEFVVDRRKHPMSVPSSNSEAFPPSAVVPHTRRDDGSPASKHGVLGHGKGLSRPSRSTFVRPERAHDRTESARDQHFYFEAASGIEPLLRVLQAVKRRYLEASQAI